MHDLSLRQLSTKETVEDEFRRYLYRQNLPIGVRMSPIIEWCMELQ